MRGSSQPRTWPSLTSRPRKRFESTVYVRLRRANSYWRGRDRHRQVLDQPVVERPVVLELERADGVGDALDGVRLAMGEVVQRIDAPLVAGPRVGGVQDPVEHRVAQVDVRRGHVDLRPSTWRRPETRPRACARTGRGSRRPSGRARGCSLPGSVKRAAVLADLVGGEVVDVGLAGLDQVDGPVVELLEVVGGVVEVLAPVEAEPADVALGSRRCTPALP